MDKGNSRRLWQTATKGPVESDTKKSGDLEASRNEKYRYGPFYKAFIGLFSG